jgi:dTDP-4-amino-4,6-dideoxygalactose transaminase
MPMYVPTFQGLGVGDLIRNAADRRSFPFDAPCQVRFYRARNAIYHLFHSLQSKGRPRTVLMPDYNSGNEVLAMRAAGVTIHYFPVAPDGQIDPAVVDDFCDRYRPDVLYVIHYLGWPQPMWELTRLCHQRDMLLVEDCALALLSELDGRPLGSFGDWSVYCLYKTLPVPNGAILVQNTTRVEALEHLTLHGASVASAAGRTTELLVQRVRSRLDRVGAVLQSAKRALARVAGGTGFNRSPIGDIGFTLADVDLAMSAISTHLLGRFDFEAIRQQRALNFERLAARLEGHASTLRHELRDGVCPLFFPLLVPDKPAAAQALRERGIQALEFWNEGTGAPECGTSPTARYLRAHVLGLPVHQDLTSRHMAYIAHHVTELGLRMPA